MNILLTCVGRRSYLVDYFKAVLEPSGGKVYAANSHPNAAGLAAADGGIIVPSVYDRLYIETILKVCHRFEIQAIIPLHDLELPILAKARNQLAAEGINAIVSSPEVIDICSDKWKMKSFIERFGFHTPSTFLSINSALDALSAKEISFPVFIKPRWGFGSIGVVEVENELEMRLVYERVLRLIERSPLVNAGNHDPARRILIQEKLSGPEYGLDVINDLESHYVATFIKKKFIMRLGETDVAVTVADPDLDILGREIALKLRHISILDVDVIMTEEGACILDMNPRIGGGYPFSHLAGANLPAAIISWLNGEPVNPSFFEIQPGVKGSKGFLPLTLLEHQMVNFGD